MKKFLFTSLFVLFFISCEKDSTQDEFIIVQNKEWFKELQTPCGENTTCKLRINKALYEDDTVYYTSFVGALCDMYFTTSIVNISGDTLKTYSGPNDLENFDSQVTFIETLYRCEGN